MRMRSITKIGRRSSEDWKPARLASFSDAKSLSPPPAGLEHEDSPTSLNFNRLVAFPISHYRHGSRLLLATLSRSCPSIFQSRHTRRATKQTGPALSLRQILEFRTGSHSPMQNRFGTPAGLTPPSPCDDNIWTGWFRGGLDGIRLVPFAHANAFLSHPYNGDIGCHFAARSLITPRQSRPWHQNLLNICGPCVWK